MTATAALSGGQRTAVYRAAITLLGVGLLVVAAALADAVWGIWPAVEEVAARGAVSDRQPIAGPLTDVDIFLLNSNLDLSEGQAYILLIVIFGVAGAFIHTATSFATYVGNRQFKLSWIWWYLLRLIIGALVALVFLVAVLGGLVTISSNSATVDARSFNPYTIAALASLAGWFSKVAADKLEEIFEVILTSAKDGARADKLEDNTPEIAQVSLVSDPSGNAIMTITGNNLNPKSTVLVNNTEHEASYDADDGMLIVTLDQLPNDGSEVVVVNRSEQVSSATTIRKAGS